MEMQSFPLVGLNGLIGPCQRSFVHVKDALFCPPHACMRLTDSGWRNAMGSYCTLRAWKP
eukprot:579290-Pyramimonas_sp.AAC.1